MVTCAGNTGPAPYATETSSSSNFEFINNCGGQGGDPPGASAYLRIGENLVGGTAAQGAWARMVFNTPAYVHFKAAGAYTRQPHAFNAGWLTRFRVVDFSGNTTTLLNQGSGLPNSGINWASSGIFGPHLWPFGSQMDFHRFHFELMCNLPGGCDRGNYNATDANAFVFVLNDDQASEVYFTSKGGPFLKGEWTKGDQWMSWYTHDNGSGLRNERVRVDGAQRFLIDHQALSHCNPTASQTNGEFARSYEPCPHGPYDHSWTLDTESVTDGQHSISICTQDYGQYQGLNGTGGETCDTKTIRVDNNAPGAPAGLYITSENPARYLDRFGTRFSLPPDPGSPIAKVHYDVIDAEGEPVTPERTISGTNPTEIAEIEGPQEPGDYRLRVWLEDAVGFKGPASTVPIPRDTVPPAAPQNISVTAPGTARTARALDVLWNNITDTGSPIDAVHYQVLNGSGTVVVPTTTVTSSTRESISDLETPRASGKYTLRLWLSDAEGNVGAPASAPLAYECVRSDVGGGLDLGAGLGPGAVGAQVVRQDESTTLRGRLSGVGGPTAGAPICVFSRVAGDPERQFSGIAMTGPDGGWSFAIDAGPSRELTAAYRPGQRELTAGASLLSRVRPTFRMRKRVVKNKGYAVFTGAIPGPRNDKVLVVLQVKSGKGWRAFRRYRTRENGRFVMRYRFSRTFSPTTYVMRAQVRSQSGYPYLQGNSRSLPLRVMP